MPSASDLETGEDEVVSLVRRILGVADTVNAALRGVLVDLDLTDTMGAMLWLLDPSGPPLRMREVAAALGCDPSNVTLMGDTLEARDLLTRQTNPHDRRSRVLALTDAGVAVRGQLLRHVSAATSLAVLTAAERRDLVRILDRIDGRDGPAAPTHVGDEDGG